MGQEPAAEVSRAALATNSPWNAHVHFHCCVIDEVFTVCENGQLHFSEAGALTPEDLVAVRQPVRARVLYWVPPR